MPPYNNLYIVKLKYIKRIYNTGYILIFEYEDGSKISIRFNRKFDINKALSDINKNEVEYIKIYGRFEIID